MEQQLDIWSAITQSGFVVQFVLLLLVVMSIVSWALVIHYWKIYSHIQEETDLFLQKYRGLNIQSIGDLDSLQTATGKFSESPLRKVFSAGFAELVRINNQLSGQKKDFRDPQFFGQTMENLERILSASGKDSLSRLDRYRGYLASIATVAPFVGLFGTVWGIINAFQGMASGGGTLEKIAPGIAEALVATAVGLAAAIPASWFYNYFSRKLSEVGQSLSSFSLELMNTINRISF